MNLRTILVGGVSVMCGLCLTLVIVSSAPAQVKRGSPRTDLINDVQQRADDTLQARRDVAKVAYTKLRMAREHYPDKISADELSGVSLEWFKVEVALAKSKPEALKAASEYLEREGAH